MDRVSARLGAQSYCGQQRVQFSSVQFMHSVQFIQFSSVQFIHSVQLKMIFFHAGKGPALSTQSLKSFPDVAVETVHSVSFSFQFQGAV